MKKALIIGGIIALVLLVPAFYGEWLGREELRELREERRLAVRAGLPLSFNDFRPDPPIADKDNAAILIREAHLLISSKNAEVSLSVSADELSQTKSFLQGRRLISRIQQESEAAKTVLRVFARPLELMRDASRRPSYYFERNWEEGAGLAVPEYASVRQLIRGLAVSAWVSSSEGRKAAALDDVLSAARISRLLREEPTVMAALVSSAAEFMILETLQQLQRADPSDAFWMESTDKVLAAFGPPIDVRHALRLEVYSMTTGLDTFMKPDAEENFEMDFGGRGRAFIRRDRRARTEILVIRAYRKLFSNWPDDPYDYLAIRKTAQIPADQIDRAAADFSSILSQMSAGSEDGGIIGSVALTCARALARRRLAEVFSESLLVKLRTGDFPSALVVKGDAATDPFTKQPFQYKKTLDGFIAYSVGDDLVDDGGASRPTEQGPPPDIVVRYP